MKKILKLVIVASVVFGIGAVATAQDAGPQNGQMQAKHQGHGMGGIKLIEKFQKDVLSGLKLTDDQMKQIDSLNKSTEEQLKAMRKANKDNGDKKAAADARKDLMKKYNESIKGILTAEQFKTYHQQMKAKMKEYSDSQKKDSNGKP